MTKTADRPSVIAMVNTVLALIGALLVTVGATTIRSINKDIANTDREVVRQSELLINSNDKINKNQLIIHELLLQIKWQGERMSDFKERMKALEAK